MYPLNDQHVYELHQLRIEEGAAVHSYPISPKRPSLLAVKVSEGTQFLGRLRKIRVQVTFEVAEPAPEGC